MKKKPGGDPVKKSAIKKEVRENNVAQSLLDREYQKANVDYYNKLSNKKTSMIQARANVKKARVQSKFSTPYNTGDIARAKAAKRAMRVAGKAAVRSAYSGVKRVERAMGSADIETYENIREIKKGKRK